jgi:hypothetical protein
VLRYRHPDLGRLDFMADEQGRGREVFLAAKSNEFWHLRADDKKAAIHQFDGEIPGTSGVFEYLRSSPYVWLAPTDKTTLQKHGAIRTLNETGSTVVLRVENAKRRADEDTGYLSMTVHLRKPDLLPIKMIVQETAETEVTWEFTAVHEDVEYDESDFLPPKIDPATWSITREHHGSEGSNKKRGRKEGQKAPQEKVPTDK